MPKTYVLFHDQCDDGFTAAWIARRHLPPDAEFIAVRYQEPLPIDPKDCDVYVLDFSYPAEVVRRLIDECNKLVILDHHKTAKEALEPFVTHGSKWWIEFNMEYSGALMAWLYFRGTVMTPPPPSTFVRYINDRDLWRKQMPYHEEITAFVKSFARTWEKWDELELLLSNPVGFERALNDGRAILRARERMVEECLGRSFEMEIAGHKIMCCPTPILQSEVAGKLAEGRDFGAVFYLKDDQTAEFSLRSRGEFDVGALAKKFGGGGHKQAAGFTVSIAQLVPQERK